MIWHTELLWELHSMMKLLIGASSTPYRSCPVARSCRGIESDESSSPHPRLSSAHDRGIKRVQLCSRNIHFQHRVPDLPHEQALSAKGAKRVV